MSCTLSDLLLDFFLKERGEAWGEGVLVEALVEELPSELDVRGWSVVSLPVDLPLV